MGSWAWLPMPDAPMTDALLTTTLRFDDSTKNTYRYEEVAEDEPARLGKVYIQKWAVEGEPPEEIEVAVTPAGVEVAA